MTNLTANPRIELVTLLAGLAGLHKKRYCWPSQDKICKLYEKRTGRRMARSTLNEQLGGLVRDGWITRTRRHRRGENGEMEMHSTLYSFRRRAIRYLGGLGAALAIWCTGFASFAADLPCPDSQTISVPSVQNHSRGGASHPPDGPNKVALEYLQRARELLRR